MQNSNQQYPTRNASAIPAWPWVCLATSIFLLIEDGLLYIIPSPWALLLPMTCLAPVIALGVLTSDIVCFVLMFRKGRPGWVKWLTVVALLLGLVSITLYANWFPYMEAFCHSHSAGCQ